MIKVINCETGEETVREQTEAEIAQAAKDAKAVEDRIAAENAKAAAKAALLERLGITEEEAKLLIP